MNNCVNFVSRVDIKRMGGKAINKEIKSIFSEYLVDKKLRNTEERNMILDEICSFAGHFDIYALHQKMDDKKFHVSKATLYNTLDVLVDAGIIVRHQINTKSVQSVQYELRILAETHLHLICSTCGAIREIKDGIQKGYLNGIKITRFTPEFCSLYVYGLCSKCKYKKQKNEI